jgi:hypothetical protein
VKRVGVAPSRLDSAFAELVHANASTIAQGIFDQGMGVGHIRNSPGKKVEENYRNAPYPKTGIIRYNSTILPDVLKDANWRIIPSVSADQNSG